VNNFTELFTIGHSNHELSKFLHLIKDNGIQAIVDVRTAPYSRYSPHFNRDNLESVLPKYGMKYIFVGKFLGGRPSDPTCYKSRTLPKDGVDFLHEVDYSEVMKRQWFLRGIKLLMKTMANQTTAIMCSEEDPAQCHRHHLITKYLLNEYPELNIHHIRGDGNIYGARSILMSVDKPDGKQLSLF